MSNQKYRQPWATARMLALQNRALSESFCRALLPFARYTSYPDLALFRSVAGCCEHYRIVEGSDVEYHPH